jgi:hypothetical protein
VFTLSPADVDRLTERIIGALRLVDKLQRNEPAVSSAINAHAVVEIRCA